MYNVIITLDESRGRSYYYSYVTENGNITCDGLPPYADPDKARSCWWDGAGWVFDAGKHAEVVAMKEAERAAAEQARREAEAVPGNADLAEAVVEMADNISAVMDAVTELAAEVAAMKGGV